MERRARQKIPRFVPLVQGLQIGMSRERRRRNLQIRISLALLRNKVAAFARICLWDDRSMGAMGLTVSRGRKLFQPYAGISAFPCIDLWARATASNATICPPQFSAMG